MNPSHGPLGLIAGTGDLPVEIARHAVSSGRGIEVVQLIGSEEPRLDAYPGIRAGLGQIGKVLKAFKAAGCQQIVFAGVVKRPDFSGLKLDMRGARVLPAALKAARKGDDALLRVMVSTFESEGFEVIGADDAADFLTPKQAGALTTTTPTESEMQDIRRAARVASEIGRLDIGQGCVVCDGLVLAVEAQEGTDAMLARVANLPEQIRGTEAERRGVLVKRPKPIQERRIDLPTVGVRTVEGAAKAGLAGIAVERGGALILDREAVVSLAEAYGLFLFVISPDEA